MDHGGEEPRPATVDSIDLGMAGAAQAGQGGAAHAHVDSQLGGATVRRGNFNHVEPAAAYRNRNSAEFARQVRMPARRGELLLAVSTGELRPHVLHADVGEFGRQRGPGDEPLVHLLFPDGADAAYDNYRHYAQAQQHRPSAGRAGVIVLVPDRTAAAYGNYGLPPRPRAAARGEALVPDGAAAAYGYYNFYVLLPRPDAERGEALVPDGAAASYGNYGYYVLPPRPSAERGVALVPDGAAAAYEYYYYVLLRRPGAERREALVPDGVGALYGYYVLPLRPGAQLGEVLVPDGAAAAYGNYGYYVLLLRPGAGRGEVLPDGVRRAAYSNYGDLAGSGRAVGTVGALRDANLGAVHYSSGAPAGDLGTPGALAEHLQRLLPFAAIVFFSVAVNGLAAGPGSTAAAFDSFSLFFGGVLLIILHVLRA